MKTKFTSIAFATFFSVFFLSSCDIIKDKVFASFSANGAEINFTIDVITNTTTVSSLGSSTINLNMDSIIKSQTGDAFSLEDIESINVQECKLTIFNPDTENNFANFEEGQVFFNTNTNPTPLIIASGPNPDVYSDSWLIPVDASVNLKPYLLGTQLNYNISGKARRATTKPLNCKLSVKFKIN